LFDIDSEGGWVREVTPGDRFWDAVDSLYFDHRIAEREGFPLRFGVCCKYLRRFIFNTTRVVVLSIAWRWATSTIARCSEREDQVSAERVVFRWYGINPKILMVFSRKNRILDAK